MRTKFDITSRKLRRLIFPDSALFRISAESLKPDGRLDMSWFGSSKINHNFLENKCSENKKFIEHSGYYNGWQYAYQGIPFEVMEGPYNPVAKAFKIQVNPRRFSGWKEYSNFCRRLFGKYDSYTVMRIDCSVLLPADLFTVDMLSDTLYAKHKQITEWWGNPEQYFKESAIHFKFRSGTKTFFSIGDEAERITGYHIGLNPRNKEESLRNKINLEIQLDKNACDKFGLESLEDFHTLTAFDPFDDIFFYDIYSPPRQTHKRRRERIQELRLLSFRYGFHVARAMLNRQNNFDKTYGDLLLPLAVGREAIPLKKLLTNGFQDGMKKFFSAPKNKRILASVDSAAKQVYLN